MYTLPDHLRPELRRIIGTFMDDARVEEQLLPLLEGHDPVMAVGDVTVMRLLKLGLEPGVCILDGSTRRGLFRGAHATEIDPESMEKFLHTADVQIGTERVGNLGGGPII